jgi:cell division protein FtsB
MKSKFKDYQKKLTHQLTRFGDIRFTGQLIFMAIVLLIFWSGAKAIQSNYTLQKQVTELKQQNQVSELQNSTIALQNNYYKSNQYLELSARQNFGLAAPGETELIVPSSVALSYTKNVPSNSSAATTNNSNELNYEAWINFFLHRNTQS